MKRQTSQKNAVEAKHDEGVAERRLRFDEEDLAVEERKEAPSSDDEDVEAPPTPSPAPPLPPRSRDHTTPRRRVEEVLDDPRSPRPNRSPVPMTWGDVDKPAVCPRGRRPPTPSCISATRTMLMTSRPSATTTSCRRRRRRRRPSVDGRPAARARRRPERRWRRERRDGSRGRTSRGRRSSLKGCRRLGESESLAL